MRAFSQQLHGPCTEQEGDAKVCKVETTLLLCCNIRINWCCTFCAVTNNSKLMLHDIFEGGPCLLHEVILRLVASQGYPMTPQRK